MSIKDDVIKQAEQWIGLNEVDSSYKKIIDTYNSIKPLPQGYKLKYTDPWCAAFVSAVAQSLNLTSIIYPECSCDRMIALYKKHNRWVENDAYVPHPGDIIFYDWDDSGIGDNTGSSDHVGIVETVSTVFNAIGVIEGNISDAVGRRAIDIDGKYIRGYGIPDYECTTYENPIYNESDCNPKPIVEVKPASNAQIIYNVLRSSGCTHAGAVGILCNLDAESGLIPNNLENAYEKRIGYTDSTYTDAVDNGTYNNFVHDSAGYGIAQWTFYSRKDGLLQFARQLGTSIGDLNMQAKYLVKELKSDFADVWRVVSTTNSIKDASDIVLTKFERPWNAFALKTQRYNLYTKYDGLNVTEDVIPVYGTATDYSNLPIANTKLVQLSMGCKGASVKSLQILLNAYGFDCGAVDGDFGSATYDALKSYQKSMGLDVDGVCGSNTWRALICS